MTTMTLAQILFASLVGFSSVSFGDTRCAGNHSKKNSLQKLTELKGQLVVAEGDGILRSLPNDPRRPLDRNKYPEYNAIGAVHTPLGRGTGWLANECLVWTAKHVFGRNKNIIGQKTKFTVGQSKDGKKDFAYEVEGVVVASGNPEGKVSDDGGEDWALIKLKKSVGKQVGFIKTAQYSVEDATTCKALEVAGFPGEKSAKTLWWQGRCPLYTEESALTGMTVGCPVTPGNSGGPLLCRETDGSLVAIGVMNQQVDSATNGLAVNFSYDWANAKRAYQKYRTTCE